jgi:O-acetyl-ADP-ribose deacetylase (regulator of RNase III)
MTLPLAERIQVVQGDITRLDVDAIVNAANSSLLGGGGVDGAIHRAAGPELVRECRLLGGCRTGEAKITRGYRLAARWVIHTVGPVWQGGDADEDALLASCYDESLKIARDRELRTVAIPAVSTGVYRFPVHRAARIAARRTAAFLRANPLPERVMLVCLGADSYTEYLTAVQEAV